MVNVTASNSTPFRDEFGVVIIVWYAAVGICGLIGNSFVIAVILSRYRLNSSHLMIIWLGCTDLISCLFLPLRYKMFRQTMTVSPSLCAVGRCIVVFLTFLNINSLGIVAIERHKAVQDINRNRHLSGKTVRALVVLCILTSAIFTIPGIWFVINDSVRCSNLDNLNIYVNTTFIGFTVPTTLIIISTFILITVLYIKICIIVRARVRESNPKQQLPDINSLSDPVRPTDEGKAETDSSQWRRELMHLSEVKEDEEYHHRAADVISCQFVDLQLIKETPTHLPKDAISSRLPIYMISRESPMPISGPPQSGRESASSCEYNLPGPSTSSLYQIPGLVMDEHDTKMQIPPPIMHSTIIHDTRNEEPVIPGLNNQYHFMVTSRVTCMLLIVTLVFFVTYLISSMMLFFPYGLTRQFFREFILINHVINPVIYSIANEGFRISSIAFLQRIRERIGFL